MALRRERSDVLEAVDRRLGLLPWGVVRRDVHRWAMYAWGASDGARPDAAAGVFLGLLRHLPDADAGRSADPARDVPALGGYPLVLAALPQDEPARNRPDALRSAA